MLDTAQKHIYDSKINTINFWLAQFLKYNSIFPHQKKALREKWLLDGFSSLTPKEQEEMQKQNQEDQQQTRELEDDISR